MGGKFFKSKQEIVNKSLEASIEMLRKYKKAFLIRSTGFGKTWIGSEIARTDKVTGKKWDKVVFIVPLISIQEGIKEKYGGKLGGIDYEFVTYQALGFLYKMLESSNRGVDEILPKLSGMDNGLFILEESHKIGFMGEDREGVNKSSKFIGKIMEKFPHAYYFGSTATPYRTDGSDMMYTFYEGNLIFPYTINQAIEDGFYRKPKYIKGNCEVVDGGLYREFSNNIKNSRTLSKEQKKAEKKRLDAEIIKYGEFLNMPKTIKDGIEATDCPKDYMRFLVFFSNHQALNAKYRAVVEWFKEAYPDMNIRLTEVTSASVFDDDDDVGTVVYDLDRKPGTIDLILTINKLAMGYHDSLITGVMLMRLTQSNIMLDQIVGRCFDMEIEHQTIIFDIVGNYDLATGALLNMGSIWVNNSRGPVEYTGVLDSSCVEVVGREVDIEKVKRLWNFDRIQQERELVWNFRSGRLDANFCAKELKIDVDAWQNVLLFHNDITGKEGHGCY